MSVSASYRCSDNDYDARQAIFPEARHDRQQTVGAAVLWDLSERLFSGVAARAEYTFIDNRSNLALFDRRRHIATVGLQITFL